MTSERTFDPATITIAPGDTVSFVNGSDEAHTVTAYEDSIPASVEYWGSGDPGNEAEARSSLQAGLLASGETFEMTFDEAGTYRYFCIPHEEQGMTGTIVVQE